MRHCCTSRFLRFPQNSRLEVICCTCFASAASRVADCYQLLRSASARPSESCGTTECFPRCFSQRKETIRDTREGSGRWCRRRPRHPGPRISHAAEDPRTLLLIVCLDDAPMYEILCEKKDVFHFQLLSIIRWKPPVSPPRFPAAFSPPGPTPTICVFLHLSSASDARSDLNWFKASSRLSNDVSLLLLLLLPVFLSFPGGRRLQSDSTRLHSQAKDQNTQHR